MAAKLCGRFEVEQDDAPRGKGVIFVMSRWHPKTFSLHITDGLNAWICEATEDEVIRKAFSWDWTVEKYLQDAEQHLGVQDPSSTYSFNSVGGACEAKKLSWSLVKDDVQLVVSWRVEKAPNAQEVTCSVLDCLIQGSSKISEELQRKKRSLDQMTSAANKALAQSEKFKDLKSQFESDVYTKFVEVLNSKKRELRKLQSELSALQSRSAATEAGEGHAESTGEDTQSSKDDLDVLKDDEDDASDDNVESLAQEGQIKPSVTGKNSDDDDSGATDIPPSDSPVAEDDSKDPVEQSASAHALDSGKKEPSEALQHPPVATTEPSATNPPVTDAAFLLSGSDYTSAPKRRRRL